jgi:hypothetical protein
VEGVPPEGQNRPGRVHPGEHREREALPLGVAFRADRAATARLPGLYARDHLAAEPPEDHRRGAARRSGIRRPRTTNSSPVRLRNLQALLDDARPGDVILIRHDGPREFDKVELKTQTQAERGRVPRHVPALPRDLQAGARRRRRRPADQTLFKLFGGEVTFEGIHFRLKPDQPKAGQTVAAVGIARRQASARSTTAPSRSPRRTTRRWPPSTCPTSGRR